ncbi:MAG TPA: glycosyltransferase family 4 protein [Terriglobales bacterium]|nr:glycosyltransferase family 4 protein [Terriglobales bacterium]
MKIALIVPPFITVPPERYGGTELFVAQLAEGLRAAGHAPVVYTVGASKVRCEIRWRSARGTWPIENALESSLDDLEHTSWACQDAAQDCDVLHLNNAPGLSLVRMIEQPMVYTLHHPRVEALSRYYAHFPRVKFVAISHDQARREALTNLDVVHHGLDSSLYQVASGSRDYLCYVGRIAPIKGTHTAIEVAKRAGIPLKIAGEIQPMYRDYWEAEVRPHVDGRNVIYVGEVDLAGKNELFAGARALLFPIDWEEPFGLVMTEAMACGVPVLAFARGSAPEIVRDGESGWLCRDAADMADRVKSLTISPHSCRQHVEQNFSVERMVERYVEIYSARHLPLAATAA